MTTGIHFESVTTTSIAEARLSMIQIFTAAHRNLRIFLPDLSDAAFKDPQTVKVLESFLIGKPNNRIEVILHNTHNLERDCARLLSVLRLHTENFLIYQTTQAAKNASDCLIIADDHSSWHKLHHDHPKVVVVFDDKNSTIPLLNRFHEILGASEKAPVTTVLGL